MALYSRDLRATLGALGLSIPDTTFKTAVTSPLLVSSGTFVYEPPTTVYPTKETTFVPATTQIVSTSGSGATISPTAPLQPYNPGPDLAPVPGLQPMLPIGVTSPSYASPFPTPYEASVGIKPGFDPASHLVNSGIVPGRAPVRMTASASRAATVRAMKERKEAVARDAAEKAQAAGAKQSGAGAEAKSAPQGAVGKAVAAVGGGWVLLKLLNFI